MELVQWDESKIQSVLVYLSDDGDDHNVTHIYVQCGIISVFLLLKLDYAVISVPFLAIPGQMWFERVMLILNLDFQGVYLSRASMDTGS